MPWLPTSGAQRLDMLEVRLREKPVLTSPVRARPAAPASHRQGDAEPVSGPEFPQYAYVFRRP